MKERGPGRAGLVFERNDSFIGRGKDSEGCQEFRDGSQPLDAAGIAAAEDAMCSDSHKGRVTRPVLQLQVNVVGQVGVVVMVQRHHWHPSEFIGGICEDQVGEAGMPCVDRPP
jgi:hypothetical protein